MSSSPFQQPSNHSSNPFTAKYPGICESCQEEFEAGTEVMYEGRQSDLVHADPGECLQFRDRPIQRPCPCPHCFLVHAGDCF